ncbi:MAG: 4Fe-4S dicluster domain-containing protein [Desulfobacter sp.]|nr:MAG: 4Fe-4S dicluster domain-containing protein [Desulfobacter sp.]
MSVSQKEDINSPGVIRALDRVKGMVKTCIQCGTCSASCPNVHFMDLTPRQMWRLVLTDRSADLFTSQSFTMCSACYWCTLRCPRGLALTAAVAELKQIGARLNLQTSKKSDLFYRLFLDNVRQYGRVREMELMGRYFLGLKNPVTPIAYTPLGLALMKRGKIHPQMPGQGPGKLDGLFEAVRERRDG